MKEHIEKALAFHKDKSGTGKLFEFKLLEYKEGFLKLEAQFPDETLNPDGSVQGGEIVDAKPLKLELEAGEAKKTDNLELAVNLPASSTVFESAADFDPKNPATFNSSCARYCS